MTVMVAGPGPVVTRIRLGCPGTGVRYAPWLPETFQLMVQFSGDRVAQKVAVDDARITAGL